MEAMLAVSGIGAAILGDLIGYFFWLFGIGCFVPNLLFRLFLPKRFRDSIPEIRSIFWAGMVFDFLIASMFVGFLFSNRLIDPYVFLGSFFIYLTIKFTILFFSLGAAQKNQRFLRKFIPVFLLVQASLFSLSTLFIAANFPNTFAKIKIKRVPGYSNLIIFKDHLHVVKEEVGLFRYAPDRKWEKIAPLPKKLYNTTLISTPSSLFLNGEEITTRFDQEKIFSYINFHFSSGKFKKINFSFSGEPLEGLLRAVLEINEGQLFFLKIFRRGRYGGNYIFSYSKESIKLVGTERKQPITLTVPFEGRWYAITTDGTFHEFERKELALKNDSQSKPAKRYPGSKIKFVKETEPDPNIYILQDRLFVTIGPKIYEFKDWKWNTFLDVSKIARRVIEMVGDENNMLAALELFTNGDKGIISIQANKKFELLTSSFPNFPLKSLVLLKGTPYISLKNGEIYAFQSGKWSQILPP